MELRARASVSDQRTEEIATRDTTHEAVGDPVGHRRRGSRTDRISTYELRAARRSLLLPPANATSGARVLQTVPERTCLGLDAPPWPGELGERIYENISAEAWKLWEERMKMILNEYRLMPWQKEAQELVAEHMEDFFFGEGAALPPGTSRSKRSSGHGGRL